MPAMRATAKTSPLGVVPSRSARKVAGRMRSSARATARRALTSFAPTSTMRARPRASRWLKAFPLAIARGLARRSRSVHHFRAGLRLTRVLVADQHAVGPDHARDQLDARAHAELRIDALQ